ncbi:integrase [Ideonella sp. 4Y16]|uniref:site-specific integrase n=1 Tax=Ideonella alba TaxID=2824118 RepID=UPI001B385A0E|nr:site-specific integrase [Ideonella alba]MBQ0942734.1 integrase [Ideonella alba]
MKVIAENIYTRGQHGIQYVRRRIPAAIRAAYPAKQTHIVRSLGTADRRLAKGLARAELARIDAEFKLKSEQLELSRASLSAKRIAKLDDDQLKGIARFWVRQVLLADDQRRQAGLDDAEFDELGAELAEQRAQLGRLLAQGKSMSMFPAMHGFLHLCGLDFAPDEAEAKRAAHVFLRAVVESVDHRLGRQRGDLVDTDVVAPDAPHPLPSAAPERAPAHLRAPSWEAVFETWRDYVEDRPKPTTIASQTAWRDLRAFAEGLGVRHPGAVTPEQMTAFAERMRERGLAVPTINERILKVRAIYKIAVGKHVLKENPAAGTIGFKQAAARQRQKRRLSFDAADLGALFGSPVFTEHKRSVGQSGEASYWLPVLMFYTGARPEELAGLALSDLQHDEKLGWYLNLIDRPSDEDADLFEDGDVPKSHRRTLKNAPSVRRVPVAQELIDLGLLRYAEWVRQRGAAVLFPTLTKDSHGKLSGSFSKFFGRYKRAVGITDSRKVLYSFRHTMKDMLEAAAVPSKYLKRLMGHTTGDGAITDGYGSDLPFELLVEQFRKVRFPALAAKPWQPGQGYVSLKVEA